MTHDRIHLTTEQIMLVRQGAQRLRHQFEGTFNMETIELGADAEPADLFLCVHDAGRSQMGAGWLPQPWTDEIARAEDVIVSMGQR